MRSEKHTLSSRITERQMKRLKWRFHVITFVLQAALSWVTSRRDAGPNLAAFAPSAIVEAHAKTFAELSLKWATRATNTI